MMDKLQRLPAVSLHLSADDAVLEDAHLKEHLPQVEQVFRQGEGPLQQLLEGLSPLLFPHCMPGAHCNLILMFP